MEDLRRKSDELMIDIKKIQDFTFFWVKLYLNPNTERGGKL